MLVASITFGVVYNKDHVILNNRYRQHLLWLCFAICLAPRISGLTHRPLHISTSTNKIVGKKYHVPIPLRPKAQGRHSDDLQVKPELNKKHEIKFLTNPIAGSKTFINAPADSFVRANRHRIKNSQEISYDSTFEALRAYHKAHGDLVLPRRFIVPFSSEYPKDWHGVDLSTSVYNMKWWQTNVRYHPSRVSELNELGFVWERLQPEWNIVLEALITYSSINGNLLVPTSFVVPHGDETQWPKATWGIPLGRNVRKIRARQDFVGRRPDRVQQLNAMGFIWDLSDYNFRRCLRAMMWFSKLNEDQYKALRVPNTFVVPYGHESGWPEDLWGFPLGAKCCAIRQKGLYVRKEPSRVKALTKLGFQWNGNSSLGWLEVVHAAAIYSQMNGRVLNVPQSFVVPCPPQIMRSNEEKTTTLHQTGSNEAWPWPEKLWGLKLGQRLKDIRQRGTYLKGKAAAKRRAQLDTLGFVWNPKSKLD